MQLLNKVDGTSFNTNDENLFEVSDAITRLILVFVIRGRKTVLWVMKLMQSDFFKSAYNIKEK